MLFNYLLRVLLLASVAISVVADECQRNCGGVDIPFPFGIGDGCYFNETGVGYNYEISCNETTMGTIPFYNGNISLVNISFEDHTFVSKPNVAYQCYANGLESTSMVRQYLNTTQFTVSRNRNKFVAIGCDTQANVVGDRRSQDNGTIHYATGCLALCYSGEKPKNGMCSGLGCCETPIPDGVTRTEISAWSYFNHTNGFNDCSVAAVVENGTIDSRVDDILDMGESELSNLQLPMVFDWWIVGSGCKLCGMNTNCSNEKEIQGGYRCHCKEGYRGNPYLLDGCQDVDECKAEPNPCERAAYCYNIEGSHKCKCPFGFLGHANSEKPCHPTPIIIGVCIGLFAGLLWLVQYRGRMKLLELRESCFRHNGGLILCQKLYRRDIYPQKFLIFTAKELEKATSNYNETSIIGRGGFGVVYKGVLANGHVVAIKRSLQVDPTQVEQFINEILVLSEINNKNVVKLLGCCLETEVPLLVYDFIRNGTLYEHLHEDRRATLLSWEVRLSIAESVASVLSYLHTTIAIPIIHRDVKSMNILLDEDYTAKVSDFGASKLGSMDESQLITMVLGTLGYLDPEYMQTSTLTEKSDVYSFGVVLVELLTRKKALSIDSPEDERCLAMHFLRKMKEECLFNIIDEQIMKLENLEQIKEVANLAKQCLHVKGDDRPTMKEVATELEIIRRTKRQPLYEVEEHLDECELLFIETLIQSEDSSGAQTSQSSESQTISLLGLNDGR